MCRDSGFWCSLSVALRQNWLTLTTRSQVIVFHVPWYMEVIFGCHVTSLVSIQRFVTEVLGKFILMSFTRQTSNDNPKQTGIYRILVYS
jgi:hypothetical protein